MNRPVPDIGIEGPGSRRPEGDARPESSMRNQVNWNRSKRSEDAIDGEQHPRRGVRVDAEDFKDSADQVGIGRRLPCTGACMSPVGIAETLPQGNRTAHAAHLKAKAEVVFSG